MLIGVGKLQRRIVWTFSLADASMSTGDLARVLLDRGDPEAIREVRRCADSLSRRGVVETGSSGRRGWMRPMRVDERFGEWTA